jgi:predicted acetyltransferase
MPQRLDATTLDLVEPTEALERTFCSYVAEFVERKEKLIPFPLGYETLDFGAMVRRLRDDAKGIDLPEGYVPASSFWLVESGQTLVGVAHLRHRLTPLLAQEGGHIGYSVRPSRRNQGLATVLLGMTLQRAKAMGLSEILVTCDKVNVASAKVIQKNGGRLDSEVQRRDGGGLTQRYWLKL